MKEIGYKDNDDMLRNSAGYRDWCAQENAAQYERELRDRAHDLLEFADSWIRDYDNYEQALSATIEELRAQDQAAIDGERDAAESAAEDRNDAERDERKL